MISFFKMTDDIVEQGLKQERLHKEIIVKLQFKLSK